MTKIEGLKPIRFMETCSLPVKIATSPPFRFTGDLIAVHGISSYVR